MNNPTYQKYSFDDAVSKFTIFFIFASLTYQSFFCFANTHLFGVSKGTLIFAELALISVALVFFISKMNIRMMLFIIFLIVNTLLLSLFKGNFDPKTIRDFLIPVLMLWLGMNYNNKIQVDNVVKYCAFLVIAVGIFEAAFVGTYESLFNVARYHQAIGLISENAMQYRDDALSLNGIRYGGRNFLSFLGEHRISSVFLETVNMGNFSAIIACWGLAKEKTLKSGMLVFLGLAVMVALLADSRFGLTLIAGLTIIRFILPSKILQSTSYIFPLIIMAMTLIIYHNGYVTFTDDFKGRLGFTGFNLSHFSVIEYLGLSSSNQRFGDSGYSQTIFANGLIFNIFAWIFFCNLNAKTEKSIIYKSLIAIFIAAILAVSGTSIFAMKVSVLMWFLMGVILTKNDSSINLDSNEVKK